MVVSGGSMSKASDKSYINALVVEHINRLYRQLEQYYGTVHLNAVDHRSYKLGIKKIQTALSRSVLRTYYDYGGRR